jgi:WD40 repeat protein
MSSVVKFAIMQVHSYTEDGKVAFIKKFGAAPEPGYGSQCLMSNGVLVAGSIGKIELFDLKSGRCFKSLSVGQGVVRQLVPLPNGTLLAAVDSTVQLWS